MPVAPYTEPNIKPVTTWPQTVEERLAELEHLVDELSVMHGSLFEHGTAVHTNERIRMLMFEQSLADMRQQVRDLQAANSALIVAMLKTEDGDENDDTDF